MRSGNTGIRRGLLPERFWHLYLIPARRCSSLKLRNGNNSAGSCLPISHTGDVGNAPLTSQCSRNSEYGPSCRDVKMTSERSLPQDITVQLRRSAVAISKVDLMFRWGFVYCGAATHGGRAPPHCSLSWSYFLSFNERRQTGHISRYFFITGA